MVLQPVSQMPPGRLSAIWLRRCSAVLRRRRGSTVLLRSRSAVLRLWLRLSSLTVWLRGCSVVLLWPLPMGLRRGGANLPRHSSTEGLLRAARRTLEMWGRSKRRSLRSGGQGGSNGTGESEQTEHRPAARGQTAAGTGSRAVQPMRMHFSLPRRIL